MALFMHRIEVLIQHTAKTVQTYHKQPFFSNIYSPKISMLLVLNSPARLLNDTTAVYLWSSSTVSVVLTVSILVAVS